MGKWSLEVDRSTCISTGMCTATASDYFRLEDAGAIPVADSVDPDDSIVDAAESCPVEAILVRDSDGAVVAPQI
ncbi:ferredoxin [Saccharothrix tamanrassetensis]|uniref:Ferredoxin n=1 Tax=Saccharothrix tamanrassetensis TaxID=1051531 RepID=A0A841CQG8_9PSEU|nr:ferredoxin [Saccharothrix tamanrassetensis]MBB5957746.1 ferredoxin [Saccharothrix tamanrassetensis]